MAQSPDTNLPTADDVDAAAQRLAGVALRTPLVTSPVLDALIGARVFLKAETLQRHAALVPPYDDPFVIAGQGTTGREIVEDLARLGLAPDVVAVTASGGGLTAGIALAVKARVPQARLYTAEPAGFDDHARSFKSGKRERNTALTG